jgi:hypothetical protein
MRRFRWSVTEPSYSQAPVATFSAFTSIFIFITKLITRSPIWDRPPTDQIIGVENLTFTPIFTIPKSKDIELSKQAPLLCCH